MAGVVLLTDGRDTPKEIIPEGIAALKNFGVKVFPVTVGSENHAGIRNSTTRPELPSTTATIDHSSVTGTQAARREPTAEAARVSAMTLVGTVVQAMNIMQRPSTEPAVGKDSEGK